MLVCILSTSVVDLSEFGAENKHGDSLLGITSCVCAEDMKVHTGKLVDFDDVWSL